MPRLKLPLRARFAHLNGSEEELMQRVHRIREKLGPIRHNGVVLALINIICNPIGVSTHKRSLTLGLIE